MKNAICLANWCPLLTIMREDDWPVGYLAVCFGGDETGVLQFKLMVRLENQIQSSRQQTEHWHYPKRDFYRANYLCFNRFTSNIVFRQCWTVLLWLSFFKYLDMASDSTVSPPYLVPVPAPYKISRQTVVQVTCTSVFCFSFQFRTWLNTVTMETSRWIYRQLMIEEFHNSSINK